MFALPVAERGNTVPWDLRRITWHLNTLNRLAPINDFQRVTSE